MKKFLFLLLSCTPAIIFCQVANFSLSLVNDSLKNKASVIKRSENIFFEVTDEDKAYLTVHKVFTVTNVNGKDALMFNEYSNKAYSLNDAEIKVFDASGKQTGKYKMSDMRTSAMGEGLVDDGKVTYFEIPAFSYPVTVDLKYEIKYKGTLFYPAYQIQSSGEAVESSSFVAKVPGYLDLRYKTKNISLTPEISTVDKYKFYKWTVKNLPAPEYEEGSVKYESRYPQVILAPNVFRIYDTEGTMTSWKSFGMWEYNLTKGLYDLSAEKVTFFTGMVKDAKTEKEKIKIIYQYLQKNFRYVSIQLGIGGYKPFPASFTDQKKYGDCKGLSFYTHAVLNSLGIKSYVALINAEYNREPVDPAFPCNQFNHMILCVPNAKDTTWLECTSRTNDFGVLGSFTENRNALLITANGGELVKTPVSKASDNIFNSKTVVVMEEDGSGKVDLQIDLKGEYKQDFLYYTDEKKDEQKNFLVTSIGLKQPDDFLMTSKDTDGKFTGMVELVTEKIPEFSAGSKVFLNKHLYKIVKGSLPAAEKRRLDYFFRSPFEKTDTTVYKLPADYIPDVLPPPKTITGQYSTYNTNCWYDEKENAVYSVAKVTLTKNRIPAADYPALKKCFDDMMKDDSQHIVVKKK